MGKKSDVKKLYDTYGAKMCLAPFLNSFYTTHGVSTPNRPTNPNSIRPCSLIAGGLEIWQTEKSSIIESRNNTTWRNLRQQFLDGNMDQVKECSVCINAELAGSSSPRILNNEYLFEHMDIDIISEVQRIIDAGMVTDKLYAIDYMPSNYCNYACIMCNGGASSTRLVFEIKNSGIKSKPIVNPVDSDFFALIKDVKILGFSGGETILQPEVIRLIDYIIENNFASDMIITILTNVSDFPDDLAEKFKKFKKVLYTISIDGVGDVIEYQRRGAVWSDIEKNARKIHQSPVHEIVNHVVTAVNILSAMDFVDWCHANDLKFAAISHVFQSYLGIAALPPELKELALARLKEGRKRYEHYLSSDYINHEYGYVRTIDHLISTVENVEFNTSDLAKFIEHIRLEDTVSKKPLREVVPEWAPWFN
jgi:MoaA/NifB/PqqE/SkfB family radical SAM enzyme